MQKSVSLAIYLELGKRKTTFRPRDPDAWGPPRDRVGDYPWRETTFAVMEWVLLYGEMFAVLLTLYPLTALWGLWVAFRLVTNASEVPLVRGQVLVPS